ncbi:unnamed protein product [Caenorhabditis auriculariae]|uniref:Protein kinase domain-containing protein n=1 Tax=Caenorhabditis auriculariae TaxID=2777116 RepID=A0A8S1HSP2_9PELO|nr:unnamed protein product [Caenorhabditis auriculariae]
MGYPTDADWPDMKKMPDFNRLQTDVRSDGSANQFNNSSVARYMEKFKIENQAEQLKLLQRLLCMDPTKRVSCKDALDDLWFKQDPKPTDDVFDKNPIPYPKKEYLPESENKKSMLMGVDEHSQQHNTHPQITGSLDEPANKMMRLNAQMQMPGTTVAGMFVAAPEYHQPHAGMQQPGMMQGYHPAVFAAPGQMGMMQPGMPPHQMNMIPGQPGMMLRPGQPFPPQGGMHPAMHPAANQQFVIQQQQAQQQNAQQQHWNRY